MARLRAQYADRGFVAGDAYYVVDAKWYHRWQSAVGYSSTMEDLALAALLEQRRSGAAPSVPPVAAGGGDGSEDAPVLPPIDNSALLRQGGCADVASILPAPPAPAPGQDVVPGPSGPSVRVGIVPAYEYHLLGEEIWHALHAWYGGGPAIRRLVAPVPYSEAGDAAEVRVALYPELNEKGKVVGGAGGGGGAGGSDSDDSDATVDADEPLTASAAVSAGRRGKDIHPTPISSGPNVCAVCAAHARNRCGKCKGPWYCSALCQRAHWTFHKAVCTTGAPDETRYGTVGLRNLGNTCFMNSALQCMSAAWSLTRYFLSDKYKADLNPDNVLGTKGVLASAYAGLLQEMWLGSAGSVAPMGVKRAIGTFNKQFSGFAQHDAQELLTFMLDGLHEDVNLVKKKEYVETEEAGDLSHAVASARAWEKHQLRNRSAVVDLMHGQYRSTVVCPTEGCGRVSVTFDPFQVVTLQLPAQSVRNMKVFLARLLPIPLPTADSAMDGDEESRTILQRFFVPVPKTGTVEMLKAKLSQLCGIPAEQLFVADVFKGRIHETLPDALPVSRIREDDTIVVYERRPLVVAPQEEDRLEDEPTDSNSAGDFRVRTDADGTTVGGGIERITVVVHHQRRVTDEMGVPELTLNGTIPLVLSFARRTSVLAFRVLLWRHIRRYVIRRDTEDEAELLKALPLLTFKVSAQQALRDGIPITEEALDMPLVDVLRLNPTGVGGVVVNWANSGPGSWPARFVEKHHLTYTDHASVEAASKAAKGTRVTLSDCLNGFTEVEQLDKANTWYCNRCKDHVQASKCMALWKAPEILVLHLKRFEYRNVLWRDKLDTLVEFPLTGLDMGPYVLSEQPEGVTSPSPSAVAGSSSGTGPSLQPLLYDCFGVVNHFGSMAFGHYTAFTNHAVARGQVDEAGQFWHLYDDASVSSATPADVVDRSAYVLFYRRRRADGVAVASTAGSPSPGAKM